MDSTEEQKLLDKLPAKDKAAFLAMKAKEPKRYNAILKTLYGGQGNLRDVSHLNTDKKTETANERRLRHSEEALQQPGETVADYKDRIATKKRVEQANRDLIEKQDRNYGTALGKGERDALEAMAYNNDLKNTDKLARLADQKDMLAKLKSMIKQAREAKRAANKASQALYKDKGAKIFNDLYEMDDKGRYHFTGDHNFFSVDDFMTVGKRKEITAQELRDTGRYDDELEGIAKEVRDSYKGKKISNKELAGEVRKTQNAFLKEKIIEMGKNPDAMLPVYGVKNWVKQYLTGDNINSPSMLNLAITLDRLEEKKEAGILTPSEELFLLTMNNEKAKIDAQKAREDAIKEVAFMLNDKDTLAKLKEYGIGNYNDLVDLLSSDPDISESDLIDSDAFVRDLVENSKSRLNLQKGITAQLKDLKKESQGLRDAAKKGLKSSTLEQVKDAIGNNWWLVEVSGGGEGNAKGMIREEKRNGKKYLVGYTVTSNGNSGYSPNTAIKPWYMEEITDDKSVDDMLNGARRNLENNPWLTGNDMSKRQIIGEEAGDTQEIQKIAELVGKSLSEAEKLYTPSEIKQLALKGKLQVSKKDGKFKCTREFARDYADKLGEGDVSHIPGIRIEKSDIGKNREKTTTNLSTITGNVVDPEDTKNNVSFEDLWHALQAQGIEKQSNMVEGQAKNGNTSVKTINRDGQTFTQKTYKGQNMTITPGKNGVTVTTNYNSHENRDLARDMGLKWFKSLDAKEQEAFTKKLGMSKAYIATDAGQKAFRNACADHVYEDPELKKEFIAKAKGEVTQSGSYKELLPNEEMDNIANKMQYESYTKNASAVLGNRLSAKVSAQNARNEQADIDARHEANKTFNDEEYAGPTDEELYKELMRQINAGADYAKAHNALDEYTASKPRPKWAPKGSEGHAQALENIRHAKSQAQKEKDEAEQTAFAHKQLNKETSEKRKAIVKKNNETKISSNILDAFEGL